MGQTPVKIDDKLHMQMKELAKKNDRYIIDEYREAINKHISNQAQQTLNDNSNLEEFINSRISKVENRLAGLVARVGMDSSINVMGLTMLLAQLTEEDRKVIYNKLRKEASVYFSRPYKDMKD